MKTYINKNGNPIIRSCFNCRFYDPIANTEKTGYCRKMPLMFAYTMNENVYAMVNTYYLCRNHKLNNEETLAANSTQIDMETVLKQKK